MSDMCDDNRFVLIDKYKKKLIEATNIETASDEMTVLDDILFRFWQMGWLDSIDRMLLVKESAKTLMHSVGDSVSAKAFRNAGRFIQNAIDGETPEFEKIPSAHPGCDEWCTDCKEYDQQKHYCPRFCRVIRETVEELKSEQPEIIRCKDCEHFHYDMPYVIRGVPVLGHEVCDFWGSGCKTAEDGFCSYAERRTDE